MHEYVATMVERPKIVFRIALISIGMMVGAGLLLRLVSDALPVFVTPPGALVVFGVIFGLYDRFLWKWKVWRFRLSAIPNLNGRWRGTVDLRPVSRLRCVKSRDCTITVHQTWSRISIDFESDFSRSTSVMASLGEKSEPHGGLRYEYDVTPMPGAETPEGKDVSRHFGVARLQPLGVNWAELSGDYYNDRSYQRWGVYKLKKDPKPVN